MRPLNLEASGLRIIRHVFLSFHRILVAQEEITIEAVTLTVIGLRTQSPRPLGINLSNKFQVYHIADGKIIPTITQIETTDTFVTERGHDEPGRILLTEGKETVRNG